jgi:hypothetical protein
LGRGDSFDGFGLGCTVRFLAMTTAMKSETITLGQIAHARSGDKGNHANVGVVAYTEAGFEFLRQQLTADRVRQFFAPLGTTRVERFELPKLGAFNFLLYNALVGGASLSLRIDTQGKLLGTAVLELELPRPSNLAAMQPAGEEHIAD